MVKLEEIEDETYQSQQQRAEDESDWESDARSDDVSDDEDDEFIDEKGLAIRQESLFQRLAALKDIIPPSTRQSISEKSQKTYTYAALGGRMIGGLAWVVSTSVLLVGLPYMLAVEDEGRLVQQEREYNQQQAGASMLGAGPPQQGQQQQGQQQGGLRPPGF